MTRASQWCAEAKEVARAFRLGASMQAGKPMVELISKVAQEVGNAPSPLKDELSRILDALLASHKRSDWLGVADYLEFELVDWLRRFFADEESKVPASDCIAAVASGGQMELGGSGQGGPTGNTEAVSLSVNSRNNC